MKQLCSVINRFDICLFIEKCEQILYSWLPKGLDPAFMSFWYIICCRWIVDYVAAYSPITSNLWKSIDDVIEWCYVGSTDNKWYSLLLRFSFTVDYSCGPGHLLLLLFLTTLAEHWHLRNSLADSLAIWTYVIVL